MSLRVRQRKERSKKSKQKLGADLLWALPWAACGSWSAYPPSPPCLRLHCLSNAAELPVSPEHQEDEWLGSPLD